MPVRHAPADPDRRAPLDGDVDRGVAATARIDGASEIADDPRWQAVVARDRAADGRFVYSVRTTGVYCRPSCASRRAHPRNMAFHDSVEAAEAAGFRPCRRCRPDAPALEQQHAALVAAACRTIEQSETAPTLAALADAAGLSAWHFHRVFRNVTGLTPRGYAAGHRARRVREGLARAERVTDAIYDAGFGSASRFYAQSEAMLGMTPARYRGGGEDMVIRSAIGRCSLGAILVAASMVGVCAILLGDDPALLAQDLRARFPRATLVEADADFAALVAAVVALVEAPHLGHALPLDIRGTAFQQRVWAALAALPAGHTASYADIACAIGAPAAVRAVAQACGANALAVAIPCHRVVRRDGALSGYRWGLARKAALLAREAAAPGDRSDADASPAQAGDRPSVKPSISV